MRHRIYFDQVNLILFVYSSARIQSGSSSAGVHPTELGTFV
jgi:hypothetical protein